MEKQIRKVTAPYIYECAMGCLVDFVIGLVMLLAFAIAGFDSEKDLQAGVVISGSVVVVLMATMDIPLLLKCLKDRNEQQIITGIGALEDILSDKNWSYKFKPNSQTSSDSCVYYYPKSWMMCRYRLAIRTADGKLIKPRGIFSVAHGQNEISNIIVVQREFDQPLTVKVRYLKHSKAIIDASIETYPYDMKKRTLEYIEGLLSEITRWTIKRQK